MLGEGLQKPIVKIGGQAIPAQHFTWMFSPGVEPYTTTFWVPPAISDSIEKLSNPVTIEINYPTFTGENQEEPSTLVLYNVYLVNRSYTDMAHVIWTVSDARWLLQGKKIYAVYNKTLVKNSNVTAFAQTNTPADLRKYFETLAQGRYAIWTVKQDGMPYSMKEIIEAELNKLGIKLWRGATKDLSYIVDNIFYHGLDAARVIEEMLSLSRLGLGINQQGEVYLYSVTTYENNMKSPIAALKESKVVDGILYAQDKSRGRPKKIRVLFEKKMETLIVATAETRTPTKDITGALIYTEPLIPSIPAGAMWWTEEDIKERRVIACVNVLPNPYPVTINGSERNPGDWIPIVDYLKVFGLTESFLTGSAWFNGCFEIRFLLHMKNNVYKTASLTSDQIIQAENIASTIRNHWRKTYMIDPYYIDQIKKWEPRLTSIINNYDRRQTPSPVFSNYFYLPMRRTPDAINDPNWKNICFNWDVVLNDPFLQTPAPAECGIMNNVLGIFSVNFSQPLDPSVSMTGNFSLQTLPVPSPRSASMLMSQCYPSSSHNLLTIFSIVWERDPTASIYTQSMGDIQPGLNTDAIKKQCYAIEIEADGEATFPEWEIVSSTEYARFAFVNRIISLPPGLASIFGHGYVQLLAAVIKDRQTPFNLSFLQALAKYEAGKIYNQFNDLYAGTLTVPGLKTDIILCGNLVSIQFSLSPNGCTTTYSFLDILPYPSIESSLPQKYIDYLRKNVSRNDEISYLHTT